MFYLAFLRGTPLRDLVGPGGEMIFLILCLIITGLIALLIGGISVLFFYTKEYKSGWIYMIASIPFTLLAILCVYGLTQVNRPTKSMYDREPPRSTPLNNAISDNQLGTLKKELLKGADVNLDTKYEGFPLINAIKKGNIEVVNILLEKGANVNCKDKYDDPALMVAINKKRKDIVKLLIEKGANVNIVEKLTGKTPLMFYAYDGNNEIVKLLLDKGAKLDKYNIISNNGGTYLMFFSAGGLLDYVKKLVETGADINDKDNHGRTALMYAKERKHLDVVNYLKSKGAIE